MNVLRSASLLFVPALFLACTSSSNNGGGGSDTPCGRYYNALTAFAERCGQTTGFEGESNAAARFETTCNNVLAAPGAANGLSQVDACASKYPGLACNQDAGCDLTAGTLAAGAACEESYQCAGFCKKASATGGTPCGTCAPVTALGAACVSDEECGMNAGCEMNNGAAGTCVAATTTTTTQPAPVAIGATCQFSTDCDPSQAECKGQKCTALPTAGEACDGSCALGLGCGQDKKCAAYTFVGVGVACDPVHRCQDSLCIGSSTTVNETTDGMGGTTSTLTITPGICTAPLADGAACDENAKDNLCDTFASCVSGTCQLENPSVCK